ncbi:MAG TPA: hypothetical protein VGC61_01180 [Pyrinomonadaceae bacterium]
MKYLLIKWITRKSESAGPGQLAATSAENARTIFQAPRVVKGFAKFFARFWRPQLVSQASNSEQERRRWYLVQNAGFSSPSVMREPTKMFQTQNPGGAVAGLTSLSNDLMMWKSIIPVCFD